ncbi:MAG: bifunctional DNA primase/polymerase [Aquificota bacterium]|nr:bifunctional DNA primase/polymerase [Aquificota bacterium]
MRDKDTIKVTSLTELIKAYYSLGFTVLPARTRSKAPAVPWKKYTKERPSLEQTLQLFEGRIKPNIAIVCGKVSNLVVIDIDDVEKFKRFCEECGINFEELLSHPSCVRTGKGYHIYFAYPEGSRVRVYRFQSWGFEVRGDGGIIIAPPSLHPEGTLYLFHNLKESSFEAFIRFVKDLKLPPFPEWAIKLVLEKNTPSTKGVRVPDTEDLTTDVERKLKDLLVRELVPYWKEGYRHTLALGLAGWLGSLGLPEEFSSEVVSTIAGEAGDPEVKDRLRAVRDTYQKLARGRKLRVFPLSGRKSGKKQKRW